MSVTVQKCPYETYRKKVPETTFLSFWSTLTHIQLTAIKVTGTSFFPLS